MKRLLTGILAGLTLVSLWGLTTGSARTQEKFPRPEAEAQEGVEVLARGPVHEAFAQPVLRRQGAAAPIPQKPPDPIPELPPDQKPAGDVEWMSGYWAWEEDRDGFIWVSGIWRSPVPGHDWVPGYWQQADSGWRWVSGYWALEGQTQVELLPTPPDPVPEAIPPAPADEADATYVPGCWVYRETNYWWRPGHWVRYRPGWVWITPCYNWTPAGYVFVDGYWDHDLHHRGLCFAPVYFHSPIYTRPGWHYRPHYGVHHDFLLGALFVSLTRNHYYFGDYYDAGYHRRGFLPWVDYRVGQRFHDPLYSYYRWRHRDNQRWEQDLRTVYANRRDDKAARPPHTLTQQLKTGSKAETIAALAPINQFKTSAFKMEPFSKERIDEVRKQVDLRRALSGSRQKNETEARIKGSAAKTGTPVTAKLELPKARPQSKPGAEKAPPPRPTLSKPEARQPEKATEKQLQPKDKPEPKTEKQPAKPPKEAKPPAVEPKPVTKQEKPPPPKEAKPQPKPEREKPPPPVEPKPVPKAQPKTEREKPPAPKVERERPPAPVEKPAPRVERENPPAPAAKPLPKPEREKPPPRPQDDPRRKKGRPDDSAQRDLSTTAVQTAWHALEVRQLELR